MTRVCDMPWRFLSSEFRALFQAQFRVLHPLLSGASHGIRLCDFCSHAVLNAEQCQHGDALVCFPLPDQRQVSHAQVLQRPHDLDIEIRTPAIGAVDRVHAARPHGGGGASPAGATQDQARDQRTDTLRLETQQGRFHEGLLRSQFGAIAQGHGDELVHGFRQFDQRNLQMGRLDGIDDCSRVIQTQDASQVGAGHAPFLQSRLHRLTAAGQLGLAPVYFKRQDDAPEFSVPRQNFWSARPAILPG